MNSRTRQCERYAMLFDALSLDNLLVEGEINVWPVETWKAFFHIDKWCERTCENAILNGAAMFVCRPVMWLDGIQNDVENAQQELKSHWVHSGLSFVVSRKNIRRRMMHRNPFYKRKRYLRCRCEWNLISLCNICAASFLVRFFPYFTRSTEGCFVCKLMRWMRWFTTDQTPLVCPSVQFFLRLPTMLQKQHIKPVVGCVLWFMRSTFLQVFMMLQTRLHCKCACRCRLLKNPISKQVLQTILDAVN